MFRGCGSCQEFPFRAHFHAGLLSGFCKGGSVGFCKGCFKAGLL